MDDIAAPEVRDWRSQAVGVTKDGPSAERFKSLAVHAETKLHEALKRCDELCPPSYTKDGAERPNKLKTAVCCQLLGEFGELCGPFAPVLKQMRDELIKSLYSWYYATDSGSLAFDQQPWFSVATRLQREKTIMIEERDRFKQMLASHQVRAAWVRVLRGGRVPRCMCAVCGRHNTQLAHKSHPISPLA